MKNVERTHLFLFFLSFFVFFNSLWLLCRGMKEEARRSIERDYHLKQPEQVSIIAIPVLEVNGDTEEFNNFAPNHIASKWQDQNVNLGSATRQQTFQTELYGPSQPLR